MILGISDFIQSFIVTEERIWGKKTRLINSFSQSINTEKRARDVRNFFIIRSNLNHSYACDASCKSHVHNFDPYWEILENSSKYFFDIFQILI